MLDILAIVSTVLLFGLAVTYTRACENLKLARQKGHPS